MTYPRIATLRDSAGFQARLDELQLDLPHNPQFQPGIACALARPLKTSVATLGNRFCILPMEGWDGTLDGHPTDLTKRRWERFGISGAKLIWGGEAVAVRHDGRANPNQLVINDGTMPGLSMLRTTLINAHRERFTDVDNLSVGLQLTHSGRYSVPNEDRQRRPRTIYRHPILDSRCGIESDATLLTDAELDQLADDFVAAAGRAQQCGFTWVDIKHCHGYLGHELLSAWSRPGRYGGSFENRTRFLRTIVSGIRTTCPGLGIGVRVSVFDWSPFCPGDHSVGVPEVTDNYKCGFGGDTSGQGINLEEPIRFLQLLSDLNIEFICTTCGSPYYNPHIQRPALFPPSDGYLPPEDPLVGVHRQIAVTAELKRYLPDSVVVGSGYSYLQQWLPAVGDAVIEQGMADVIGVGRMVLSYPELPADVIAGTPMQRKQICRTFSDCTTAPRNGLVSGCFPLDPFYKRHADRETLLQAKSTVSD